MSQDVFQKKLEEKYDKYFNNVNSGVPANLKNNSSGVKGVFGGSGGVDDDPVRGDSHYDGLLPNLNMSRREQLEQELMNEISEPRKDKYMTPNLHGGKLKAINKLAAYSNQGGRSNAPYFHERNSNTSKNRI